MNKRMTEGIKMWKKVSQASNENCFQHCLSVFSTNKHMANLSVVLTE